MSSQPSSPYQDESPGETRHSRITEPSSPPDECHPSLRSRPKRAFSVMSQEASRPAGGSATIEGSLSSTTIVSLCDELQPKVGRAKRKAQELVTISAQVSDKIRRRESLTRLEVDLEQMKTSSEKGLNYITHIESFLQEISGHSIDASRLQSPPQPFSALREAPKETTSWQNYPSGPIAAPGLPLTDSHREIATPERDLGQQDRSELVRSTENILCHHIATYEELKRTLSDQGHVRRAEDAGMVLTRLHHHHTHVEQAAADAILYLHLIEKCHRDYEQHQSQHGVIRCFQGADFASLKSAQTAKRMRMSYNKKPPDE